MKKLIIAILILLGYSPVSFPVEIPRDTRVRILSARHPDSVTISSPGGKLHITEGIIICDTVSIRLVKGGFEILAAGRRYSEHFAVYGSEKSVSVSMEFKNQKIQRTYRGAIEITPEGRELCIVNMLPFEDFVHGAAVSESGELLYKNLTPLQQESFLSVMEICVRSYLTAEKKRHSGAYQFCDLTHCVHYEGETGIMRNLTAGKILTGDNGESLRTYFHSACGGLLTGPEVFWEHSAAVIFYRRGADSDENGSILCSDSPHSSWNYFLKDSDAEKIFGITPVSILLRLRSSRITSIEYEDPHGLRKEMFISKFMSDAGKILGWNAVKSNYFAIRKKDGGWLLEGKGLGHGVGLCQYGAWNLARRSWSVEQILSFYFPGAKIIQGGLR